MIFLRSTLANLTMLLWTLVVGFVAIPFLFIQRPVLALNVIAVWAEGMLLIVRALCGVRWEMEGTPPEGKAIVASKHQSAWETLAFYLYTYRPAFVVKRELIWIPVLGWYVAGVQSIAIDRKAGRKALEKMVRQSREKLEQGRQVIIFPEGTRMKPGERGRYHSGIAAIYAEAGVPVVPVALDSGTCWPKNSWCKYPGTIHLKFLEPIQPGLPREEFMKLLEERIEAGQKTLGS